MQDLSFEWPLIVGLAVFIAVALTALLSKANDDDPY